MSSSSATLLGCGAILLWSLLALFTAASGAVPPFQLAAMTFALGGLVGCASWLSRRGGIAAGL
ncbi:EamA family transporter, partial [Methylobacterium sp. WL116]